MRTRRLIAAGFVLGAAALATGRALSQEEPGHDPAEMERMMALWQEISTPGEHHRKLDFFVGEWDTTTRIWMAGPDAPPQETQGTVTHEWILGGRFILSRSQGLMMGMPVEGIGLTGYDNYKKKYLSIHTDSMNTAILTAEGTIDRTGKVFTYFGSMDEWMTGEHDKTVKWLTRIVDEDTYVFEVHDLAIVPGETKVVELECRRQKPADAQAR